MWNAISLVQNLNDDNHYTTRTAGYKGVYTFPNELSPKVNVIV